MSSVRQPSDVRQDVSPRGFAAGRASGAERDVGACEAPASDTPGSGSRQHAKHVAAPGQDVRLGRRQARFAQREVLWDVSRIERVRECGRVPFAPKGQKADAVRIRCKDGVAHYAGLTMCGSVWACPVCEPKIANGRAEEVAKAAGAWDQAGNSVFMVTLTVRHHMGEPLAGLLAGISKAFRSLLGSRSWRALKTELGIAGTIRSLEITYGDNGFHPHFHVLVFVEGDPGAAGLASMYAYFEAQWPRVAVRCKLGEPDPVAGMRVERCHSAGEAGAYVAKTAAGASVGNEMTRADLKTGRKGHRTPFQVLEDFRQHGDGADLAVWREYEQATRARQQLTWSKGLRKLLGGLADIGEERSDEELAAEEVGGEDVTVIPLGGWRKIVAVPGLAARLLDAAERDSWALTGLLAEYGIRPFMGETG